MKIRLRISNGLYVIISLLAAVIIWVFVTQEINPDQTDVLYNVPVVFTGVEALEERGFMISSGEEQTVTISIQAKRDVIQAINDADVYVAIDVSTITEAGDYSLVDYTPVYPTSVSGDPITIRSRTPTTISYTISKRTQREVEIRGSFVGSVAEGLQAGDLTVVPDTILIYGLEEYVNQVSYAQVTLNQENLSETYTGELDISLIGTTGEVLTGLDVDMSMTTAKVSLPVVTLKQVDLTVEITDGGGATEADCVYAISPSSIVISGSASDVAAISEISLGSISLAQVFSADKFVIKIPLAEELTNVSGVSEATVTVEVKGLTTATVETDQIEFINVPEGYEATSLTEFLAVTIRGDEETVSAVIPSQVRVVADLEYAIAVTGNQTIPVKIYLDSSGDAGVLGESYSIVVTITSQ